MAAVFASIAAIAVGTGGTGSIQNFQDMNPSQIIGKFAESPSNILSRFRERPEPENSAKIILEISGEQSVSGEAEYLSVRDFTSIVSKRRNLSSDKAVRFHEFSGSLKLEEGNMTVIQGSSSGFTSSNVKLSQSMKLSGRTDAEEIKMSNVSKERIKVDLADVRIESREDSTVIEKEDTSFRVNSFSGSITYYRENASLVLDGKVDRVEAGGISFSG